MHAQVQAATAIAAAARRRSACLRVQGVRRLRIQAGRRELLALQRERLRMAVELDQMQREHLRMAVELDQMQMGPSR